MEDSNKTTQYKAVHVKETCKIAEISDAFNKLRYKVILTSQDTLVGNVYELAYQIQVVNYFIGPEPFIIYEYPNIDNPLLFDYDTAISMYSECVRNYTSLVKAETREFKDIDIYKEKINYHLICPECCTTCKWFSTHTRYQQISQKTDDIQSNTKGYCLNSKNAKEYLFDLDLANELEFMRKQSEESHGHKNLHTDNSHYIIYPKTDIYGVCDNYEKIPQR